MAYQPTSNCNAANYNPNDVVQDYQTAPKASYQQIYPNQTNDELWKSQLGGAFSGQIGLSGIGSAALGKPVQTESLRSEADRVRAQSDQLKILLMELHERLFEPLPLKGCGQALEKDNPSTIEGNLQHAARTLSSAILSLESILAKIGGR